MLKDLSAASVLFFICHNGMEQQYHFFSPIPLTHLFKQGCLSKEMRKVDSEFTVLRVNMQRLTEFFVCPNNCSLTEIPATNCSLSFLNFFFGGRLKRSIIDHGCFKKWYCVARHSGILFFKHKRNSSNKIFRKTELLLYVVKGWRVTWEEIYYF